MAATVDGCKSDTSFRSHCPRQHAQGKRRWNFVAQFSGVINHYDRAGVAECLAFSKTAELKCDLDGEEFSCRNLLFSCSFQAAKGVSEQ